MIVIMILVLIAMLSACMTARRLGRGHIRAYQSFLLLYNWLGLWLSLSQDFIDPFGLTLVINLVGCNQWWLASAVINVVRAPAMVHWDSLDGTVSDR